MLFSFLFLQNFWVKEHNHQVVWPRKRNHTFYFSTYGIQFLGTFKVPKTVHSMINVVCNRADSRHV